MYFPLFCTAFYYKTSSLVLQVKIPKKQKIAKNQALFTGKTSEPGVWHEK